MGVTLLKAAVAPETRGQRDSLAMDDWPGLQGGYAPYREPMKARTMAKPAMAGVQTPAAVVRLQRALKRAACSRQA